MTSASSCSSNGTVAVPYSVLLSNGFYGIVMILYCFFVTYLLFIQTMRSASGSVQKPTASIQDVASIDTKDEITHTKSSTVKSAPSGNNKSKHNYRIEEEQIKGQSSEYTRRGMLWSSHASWHLPSAPRQCLQARDLETQGLEHILDLLKKYDVDPLRGFLPHQDPLQRLPYARYHLWEDIGDDLPKLLGARLGQVRDPLRQLPILKTDKLVTDAELRRAHLLLCLFAHAYVWGGPEPLDHIPEGIAKPLWEVSEKLGMPPVLGHPSIVLYNWRRLDTEGDICMENLTTLNNFFDGRDESWFYLITVEIEARGATAVLPMMLAIDAVERYNEEKQQVTNRHDMSSRGSSLAHGDATALHRYLSAQKSMSHTSPSRVLRDGSLRSNLGRPSVGESGSTGLNRFLSLHRDRRNPSELSDLQAGRVGSLHAPMQSSGIESVLRRPMHVDDDDDVSVYQRALVGELTGIQVAKFVTFQLNKVAAATKEICLSLDCMREGCHPFIFYHRVRPFLSGWKDNPILPKGVVYQGVSEEPKQFFGGSAAQSSLIPFLDIGLGLSHTSTKSHDFLSKMREYMPRSHRQFLEYLQTVSCIRSFVQELMPSDHILDVEGKFKVSDPPTTPSAAISVTKPIDTMNQISQPKSPVASSPKATDITSVDDDNNTNSNINNNSSGNSSLRRSRNPHRSSLSAIRASMGIDTSTIKNKVEDDAVAALTRGDSEMIDNDRGELLFSPSQLDLTNLDAKYPSKSDAITKTSISDPQHQHDQEYISKKQLAKRLVDENVWLELRDTYNDCVSNLQRFRSGHINLVAEYIIAQQKNGVVKGALESSAGGKGTGGTDLMKFLKPIRDNCENSLIRTVPAGSEQGPSQLVAESTLDLSRVSEEDEMSVRSAILSKAHSRATTSKLPDVSTTAVEKAIGWRHDDEKLFATPYVKDSAAGDDIDIFHGTNSDFSSNNFIAAVSATAGEPAGISQANDTNESNKSTYLSPPPMSEVSQKDSRSYSDRSLGELWRPS